MEHAKTKISLAYSQLDGIFTKKEAWTLYKFAAYAETIGWYFHGLIFIFYLFIVFFAHRSMKWNVWQFIAAEVLSNVPFGALAFERYITKKFKR